jgi:hypothetical protein
VKELARGGTETTSLSDVAYAAGYVWYTVPRQDLLGGKPRYTGTLYRVRPDGSSPPELYREVLGKHTSFVKPSAGGTEVLFLEERFNSYGNLEPGPLRSDSLAAPGAPRVVLDKAVINSFSVGDRLAVRTAGSVLFILDADGVEVGALHDFDPRLHVFSGDGTVVYPAGLLDADRPLTCTETGPDLRKCDNTSTGYWHAIAPIPGSSGVIAVSHQGGGARQMKIVTP